MAKAKTRKKKHRFRFLKIFLVIIIILISFCAVAGVGIGLAIIKTAPPLDVNQILSLNEPSVLYAANGKFMDIVSTDQNRTVIPYKDMPQDLKNAFVSIEDERFYKHNGIDIKRITGVIYIDIKNKITKQTGVQGASTITQQLLKNTVLSNEVTIKRKLQEMYLAVQLEKHLSKDQFLEAYMNTINVGGNAYGVESAANQYFNKSAKDLNLLQCAFIAGVAQSPSSFYSSAVSKKNADDMAAHKNTSSIYYVNRTKTVLHKMYENGNISKQQYDQCINDLINNKLGLSITSLNKNRLNYEWYSIPAINQVKNDLKSQYHYTDSEIDKLLMYGGLKINTAMDMDIQNSTQSTIDNIVTRTNKNNLVQPQAAAVIMDYHTGEVKAIIGGRGQQPARSYNRAASNDFLRAPGSSIKPLTVYSPALDSKKATPGTVLDDAPLTPELGRKMNNGANYDPQNSPAGFTGYITMREAIMRSVNIYALKLENEIGINTGVEYGKKYGLQIDKTDEGSISAIALGQLDNGEYKGTNPLTMAQAYGVFGNNGTYTYARMYTKVVDKSGKVILESKPQTKSVISPQAAYLVYDLLKGPVSPGGTGPGANFGTMPVRGKTGTSTDSKNLWFCGLTPYYSAAVWIGNDDYSDTGITSSYAADIWGKIMKSAHKDLSPKDVAMPNGIVTATICKESGKVPTDLCARDPRGSQDISEMFIAGTVPTSLCDIHVEAKVNKLNGKLATEATPSGLIESRVFIKRDYTPIHPVSDQQYVVPSLTDDTVSALPEVPAPPAKTGETSPGTTPGNPPVNPPVDHPVNPPGDQNNGNNTGDATGVINNKKK